jgi:hypothetical protein
MNLYDFQCKTEDCKNFDKRISRGYPTLRDREAYPPVCDLCRVTMTEVEAKVRVHKPGKMVIKGDFITNPHKGFARGLTSRNPEDLKRDMERGDFLT